MPDLQGQGFGAGMSGVRLVGALGRDQTYVSAGNKTQWKGNGRRGGGREGPVPCAGVGAGRNRVRSQEIPEDTCGAGRVGLEVSGAAPKGQGKTQRDFDFGSLGTRGRDSGGGFDSGAYSPASSGYSPSELERAQHLAKLLGDKAKLDKSIQEGKEKVSKARLAVAEAEDDLSILQQEMKGLVNQIDAHHREDGARREGSQGGNDGMEGVFVEEVDSGEEMGFRRRVAKKRKMGKGRFGSGSGSARGISHARLLEFRHGMSEEDQITFKRNMGPYGGDDVSSWCLC